MFTARVIVEPTEEGRDRVVELLTAETASVPASFTGCELFVVSVEPAGAGRVVLAEEWQSKADFERYAGSDQFAATMAAVGPLLAGPPDSAYYEADRIGP